MWSMASYMYCQMDDEGSDNGQLLNTALRNYPEGQSFELEQKNKLEVYLAQRLTLTILCRRQKV